MPADVEGLDESVCEVGVDESADADVGLVSGVPEATAADDAVGWVGAGAELVNEGALDDRLAVGVGDGVDGSVVTAAEVTADVGVLEGAVGCADAD